MGNVPSFDEFSYTFCELAISNEGESKLGSLFCTSVQVSKRTSVQHALSMDKDMYFKLHTSAI